MKKKIIYLIVIIVLISIFFIYLGYALSVKPSFQNGKNFVITKGEGATEIAQKLKQAGIVRSAWIFEFYLYLTGKRNKILAGEYQLSAMNMPDLANYLTKGVDKETTIKIIEGWTLDQINDYFLSRGLSKQIDFFEKVGQPPSCSANQCQEAKLIKKDFIKKIADRFSFFDGKPSDATLEGYLFPDTYRVFKDATIEEIIIKMLENFDAKLEPFMRYEIDKQNKNIYEILTMASIIEAEVPHEADRAIISGILWKRLETGMPLQVDSTLNYVTGHNSRALSSSELKINSPYNTYLYPDLPPGPIGNPGLSAIKAAIYPQDSPYWFFLSTKDGKTIFSETLNEHNEAKNKYLR